MPFPGCNFSDRKMGEECLNCANTNRAFEADGGGLPPEIDELKRHLEASRVMGAGIMAVRPEALSVLLAAYASSQEALRAAREEIDLRVEQGQALNEDKEIFKREADALRERMQQASRKLDTLRSLQIPAINKAQKLLSPERSTR